MSQFVLFNGAFLVRPGAYTKIDASQFENVALAGLGIVGLIGDADGGQPRVIKTFGDAKAVKTFYRNGDLVEAAQIVADPGNDPRIPAGAQTIVCYKTNLSTKSTLTHDTAFLFSSVDYGLHTTSIQVAITTTGGNARTIQITGIDTDGNLITETSPEFGTPATYGKFSIQYVGAGSAATMTITATTLTTTVTGGPGTENLSITFANYANLNEILFFIDGLAAYTATALITNAQSFDPTNLDAVVAIDIRTTAYTAMANNFDISDWVNNNSSLITTTLTKGLTGPRIVLAKTALAGGVRGTSANSDWTTAFAAMGGLKINQLVPLASTDATAVQGTYTIASIHAALTSHCRLLSATAGRKEREGWASFAGTKTNLIAAARLQNSEHVTMSGQKVSRRSAATGNIVVMAEWAFACIAAGMRAGAPLGEPLTHKFINATALTQDASWSNGSDSDVKDLLLNGVFLATEIPGSGFQIEKGITTYTKSNNDAFTEESIVQGWKLIAYEWRTALEQRYVGRPGDIGTVGTVKPFSVSIFNDMRDRGLITDSVVNGVLTPGYRNISVSLAADALSVSAEVSPTPGINFVLNTLTIVPAQISF